MSRHVKDLESRLGLRLCRRGRGGFGLTTEGDRVYREIIQLLSSVEAFRSSIGDIHLRMGGRLAIAIFDKTATNPQAKVHLAVRRFVALAPEVQLDIHVKSIQGIERGLIDGSLHVGVMPVHRSSNTLEYRDLFGETMFLYCGALHPLFAARDEGLSWAKIRRLPFAALGYHSPNMEVSHRQALTRAATAYDREGIAALILSGEYLGFLPDHYADSFVKAGLMRAVNSRRLNYSCRFARVIRRSPEPSRAVRVFADCLLQAHRLEGLGTGQSMPAMATPVRVLGKYKYSPVKVSEAVSGRLG